MRRYIRKTVNLTLYQRDWIRRNSESLTTREIADKFKISTANIRSFCKYWNLDTKPERKRQFNIHKFTAEEIFI